MNGSANSHDSVHVSRRTVAKAAAWSVPAIAIAATVPALAASMPVVGGVYGHCAEEVDTRTYNGNYTISVTGATPNSVLQLIVEHDGSSNSVDAVSSSGPITLTGSSSNSYTFSVVVDATGNVNGQLNVQIQAFVTQTITSRATLSSTSGDTFAHPQGVIVVRHPLPGQGAFRCSAS
ncbi:hypothetical protein [Agromyces sp. SYSU T00194]|uniref:hypothetical protein n=1 Tax=Agromyces chitinivorans TaxID=3158560 RepID=UPI00339A132D